LSSPKPSRSLARAAAHALHSQHSSTELTAKAREAFMDRFDREVDPEGCLPLAERRRRADQAKRAYFIKLGYLSGKARRHAA
jgi:hypothetical protein